MTVSVAGSIATCTMTDTNANQLSSYSNIPFTVTDSAPGGFGSAVYYADTAFTTYVYAAGSSNATYYAGPDSPHVTLNPGESVAWGSGNDGYSIINTSNTDPVALTITSGNILIDKIGSDPVAVTVNARGEPGETLNVNWDNANANDALYVVSTNFNIGDITTDGELTLDAAQGSVTGTVQANSIGAMQIDGKITGDVTTTNSLSGMDTWGGVSGHITAGGDIGIYAIEGDMTGTIHAGGAIGGIGGNDSGGAAILGTLSGAVTAGGSIDIDPNDISSAGSVTSTGGSIATFITGNMAGTLSAHDGMDAETDRPGYVQSIYLFTVPNGGTISGNVTSASGNMNVIAPRLLSGTVQDGAAATDTADAQSGNISVSAGQITGNITDIQGDISDIESDKSITGNITANNGNINSVSAGLDITGNLTASGVISTVHAGANITGNISGDQGVGGMGTGVFAGHDITGTVVAANGPIYAIVAGRDVAGGIGGAHPQLTVTAALADVSNDPTDLSQFKFTRSGDPNLAMDVTFGITGGGAPGTDYDLSGIGLSFDNSTKLGTIRFAAGQTQAFVTLTPKLNPAMVGPVQVVLTAQTTQPSAADGGYNDAFDPPASTSPIPPVTVAGPTRCGPRLPQPSTLIWENLSYWSTRSMLPVTACFHRTCKARRWRNMKNRSERATIPRRCRARSWRSITALRQAQGRRSN